VKDIGSSDFCSSVCKRKIVLLLVSQVTMQPLNIANLCEAKNQCSGTEPDRHSRITTALSRLPRPSDDLDVFVREVMDLLHDFSSSTEDLQALLDHLRAGLTKQNERSLQTRLSGERARTAIGLKDSLGPVPDERDLDFVQQLREAHASILVLQVQLGRYYNVEMLTRAFLAERGDNLRLFSVRQSHHEGQEEFYVGINTGQRSLIGPGSSIPSRQKSAVPPSLIPSTGTTREGTVSQSIDTQLTPHVARVGEACIDNPNFIPGLNAIRTEVEDLRQESNSDLETYAGLVKRFLHENASDALQWDWVYKSFSLQHRRDKAQMRGETDMRYVMKGAAYKTLVTPGWSSTRYVLDPRDGQSKHLEEIGYVIFWLLWDWAELCNIVVLDLVYDLSRLDFSFGPFGVPSSAQERLEPSSVGMTCADTCKSSQLLPQSIQSTLLIEFPTDAESSLQAVASSVSMEMKSMHKPGPKASSVNQEVINFMKGYQKFILADTVMPVPSNEDGLVSVIAQLYQALLNNSRYDNYWDAAREPRKWLEETHGFAFRAEIQVRSIVQNFAPASHKAYMVSSVSIDKKPGSLPDAKAMAKLEHLLRVLHGLVHETVQLDAPVHESDRTASSTDYRTITGTSFSGSSLVTGTTNSASL
jgi:hypothetical protein